MGAGFRLNHLRSILQKVRNKYQEAILCLFQKQHSYPHKASPVVSPGSGPGLFLALSTGGHGYLAWAACRRGSLQVGCPSDQAGSSCCSGVLLG